MGIGDRQGRRTSYGNPGTVFNSLAEYQKNKEYHEQALAFAIGRPVTSEPCFTPFLSEYPEKAKGYHEKTLVIAMKLATGMEKVRVTGT